MHTIVNTALITTIVAALAAPATAQTGSIRESVENLTSVRAEQGDRIVGNSRSMPRLAAGLGLIGVGAVLLAIQPTQPSLPTVVSGDTLSDAAIDARFIPTDHIGTRRALGAGVLVCEPFCPGDVDEAILEAYAAGAEIGVTAATRAIDTSPWTLYDRAAELPAKKETWQTAAGIAAIGAGALIATVFAETPVMGSVDVNITSRGVQASRSFGW